MDWTSINLTLFNKLAVIPKSAQKPTGTENATEWDILLLSGGIKQTLYTVVLVGWQEGTHARLGYDEYYSSSIADG